MTNVTIARRYAKALLVIGKEVNNYIQYSEELNRFKSLADDNPDFFRVLSNPFYPLAARHKCLDVILEKINFSPVVSSFLRLLINNNRIRLFSEIVGFYQKLVDDLENIAWATVLSASELSDDAVENIRQAIEKVTQKHAKLDVKVDPSLIGGIITKVGDTVFDGSIRTQLIRLKETLKRGE